ncbi:hypothetical protein LTR56_027832 [Elasticomyces elasticus]|nr:hypothetical protein LTR56_027832 [Elasticomyces elasticus]
MFRWYSNAEVCIAYLADVGSAEGQRKFEDSAWFCRGWTLQELLAPHVVIFLSNTWQLIGHKGRGAVTIGGIRIRGGPALEPQVARITHIPETVLHDYSKSKKLTPEQKLAWIANRQTKKEEDMYYSLLGLFDVRMWLCYGEGAESARQRLVREIDNLTRQDDRISKVASWLSAPDPRSNHYSARGLHEAGTGDWMLQSPQYQQWKDGDVRHLWLCGKVGSGKTVLFSTIANDVRNHCEVTPRSGFAVFYFSFTDEQKQSYDDLLRSLIYQLGCKDPILSTLFQAHQQSSQDTLSPRDLNRMLKICIESYDRVTLMLDALDECPEGEVRESVLEHLEQLSAEYTNIKFLATSREVVAIHDLMKELAAEAVILSSHLVDGDIRRYVSNELARDRRLKKLDASIKLLITTELSRRSDGMFGWANCQLRELKRLKSFKRSHIQATLRNLPATLYETYDRILLSIEKDVRGEALNLLRWVAYAKSPRSLGELVEANIIDLTGSGIADFADRGDLEDSLAILSGLVTIVATDDDHGDSDEHQSSVGDLDNGSINEEDPSNSNLASMARDPEESDMFSGQQYRSETVVRLAHFSVKEYLESSHILDSDAKVFHLDPAREHRLLTQSCLAYITSYSSHCDKTSTKEDLVRYPLLEYAAKSWFYHSSAQQPGTEGDCEALLFTSEEVMHDWLLVHQPDRNWEYPFEGIKNKGSGLYYASSIGLGATVLMLIEKGADVNAQGGHVGNALQAASQAGHEKVVAMLLERGAEVNAQGGDFGNALQAASDSSHHHEEVVAILLKWGADVNAQGGQGRTALQTASRAGHEKVVAILVEWGADVNMQGGGHGNTLQMAIDMGYEDVAAMLLERGANFNAQGGWYGTALQVASMCGHKEVVAMVLERGAEVNAQGGYLGNALQVASDSGHEEVVAILLKWGADVNAQGEWYGTALRAASAGGHEKVVVMLLQWGADVNAQGGEYYPNALQEASNRGHERVVAMLLERGATVNAQGG